MQTPTKIRNSKKINLIESTHTYVDKYNNKYTSVTQAIGKFAEKFDTEYWSKYTANKEGKTQEAVKADWKKKTEDACYRGSEVHDFIETSIKQLVKNTVRILSTNIRTEKELIYIEAVKKHIPIIYNKIYKLIQDGWSLYPEFLVYSYKYKISGKIDLLAVRGNKIKILDWKTNKDIINFRAGYFKKVKVGNQWVKSLEYIQTKEKLLGPLSNLEASTGNKYSLQLSLYARLCERFGYICEDLEIVHIRYIGKEAAPSAKEFKLIPFLDKCTITSVPIKYLKKEAVIVLNQYDKMTATKKTNNVNFNLNFRL